MYRVYERISKGIDPYYIDKYEKEQRYSRPGQDWYHGNPLGKIIIGKNGIHIGTYLACEQAMCARIGYRADGKKWDGKDLYWNTLIAGKNTLKKIGLDETGYNFNLPIEDFYAKDREEKARFSDGSPIPKDAKPDIFRVQIIGKMYNSIISDESANRLIKKQLIDNKYGYYYINEGEDPGSLSAVVPNISFLKIL
jgi:hypothetical protein